MTELTGIPEALTQAKKNGIGDDEVLALVEKTRRLPQDQQHAIERYLVGGNCKLSEAARQHVAALALPAVERVQLARRLEAYLNDTLHLTVDQFRFLRTVLPEIATRPDGALVVRSDLSLAQLVYALAKAKDVSAAEQLSRTLYRKDGRPKPALATTLAKLPWLEEELAGFRPTTCQPSWLRRYGTALRAVEPAAMVGTAGLLMAATAAVLPRGHEVVMAAPAVVASVPVTAPTVPLAELRTALEAGKLSAKGPIVVAIANERLAGETVEVLTQAKVVVVPPTLVRERVPVPCPEAGDWIPSFQALVLPGSKPETACTIVLARNIAPHRVQLQFHEMAPPFQAILFVTCESGHEEPVLSSADYVRKAEEVAKRQQVDNAHSRLYIAMALQRARSLEEWNAVTFADGVLQRDSGKVQEGEALMRMATNGQSPKFQLCATPGMAGTVAGTGTGSNGSKSQ